MSSGAFRVWPANKDGQVLNLKLDQAGNPTTSPDPTHPDAVDIYFGVLPGLTSPPPKEQVDLMDRTQKVLRSIQVLYRAFEDSASDRQRSRFRSYYVRLFRLAQVGLDGASVSPDIASAALSVAIADLIDDEAGTVKLAHLKKLGFQAVKLGAGCLAAYTLLRLIDAHVPWLKLFLGQLDVDALLLANFFLLLDGSFLGVWLSYAIRTTTFTLGDLTITDADRLTPLVRLIFAGALTVVLGIMFTVPLLEIRIGTVPITGIANYPMLAFVVGCFCGISELTLPTAVARRASSFIQNIQ
jgi:hypothetical protein